MTSRWIPIAVTFLLACKAPSRSAAVDEAGAAPVQTVAAAPAKEAAPTVDIGKVLSEYKDNEVRADGEFKGKRLRFSGTVGDIKKDITDSIYVTIGTGKQFEIPTGQCFFDDKYAKQAAALSKGQNVTVECKCDGLMMNVLMKDCSFVASEEAVAAGVLCKKIVAGGFGDSCTAAGKGAKLAFGDKVAVLMILDNDPLFVRYMAAQSKKEKTEGPSVGNAKTRAVLSFLPGTAPDVVAKAKTAMDKL